MYGSYTSFETLGGRFFDVMHYRAIDIQSLTVVPLPQINYKFKMDSWRSVIGWQHHCWLPLYVIAVVHFSVA